MRTYEIEIKSLLGSLEKAEELRNKLREYDKNLVEGGKHSQLNHYFEVPGDLSLLEKNILPFIKEDRRALLQEILSEGHSYSIRTRDADGKVYFIIKASVGDDSSANGISRIEFEEPVDLSIDELDTLLIESGLTYQAKWSREREEYESNDMKITIDKNAGYGYLAEFEKVIDNSESIENVREELLSIMQSLGVDELPQERLERMFAYYNANWRDYYGTDKIFTIE